MLKRKIVLPLFLIFMFSWFFIFSGCFPQSLSKMTITGIKVTLHLQGSSVPASRLYAGEAYYLDITAYTADGKEIKNPKKSEFAISSPNSTFKIENAIFNQVILYTTSDLFFLAEGNTFQLSVSYINNPDIFEDREFAAAWHKGLSLNLSGNKGKNGKDGENGMNGADGTAESPEGKDGQSGGNGQDGYPGEDGQSIILDIAYYETGIIDPETGENRFLLIALHFGSDYFLFPLSTLIIRADGGNGGNGGQGGAPGQGGAGYGDAPSGNEGMYGIPGIGGKGGNGGSITFYTHKYFPFQLFLQLSSEGGKGGYTPQCYYDDIFLPPRGNDGKEGDVTVYTDYSLDQLFQGIISKYFNRDNLR